MGWELMTEQGEKALHGLYEDKERYLKKIKEKEEEIKRLRAGIKTIDEIIKMAEKE
jgi:hypothetical protein